MTTSMKLYPMKLTPVPKSIIWGGDKLKRIYGKTAPFDKIAESWELTVRSDGMSVIENGIFAGVSLAEFLSDNPTARGSDSSSTDFPLLVKLIDAADDLSIQVHPDDSYAKVHENDSGKTEMWYILDADDGAEIVYGVKDGVCPEELKAAILNGSYDAVLRRVRVSKGDVFFIPSGQIHAICKGVLIAEIQQNSNITYRVYDYDRTDKNGKKRELHTEKALESVKCYSVKDIDKWQYSGRGRRRELPKGFKVIADCSYFRACVVNVIDNTKMTFTVDEKSFVSLLFTSAEDAELIYGSYSVPISAGDSYFIPAGTGEITLSGSCSAIISEP